MFLKKLSLASVACLLVTSACVVNDADDDGSTGTSGPTTTTTSTTSTTSTSTTDPATTDPTTTDGTTSEGTTTDDTDPTGLTTTDTDTDSGTDTAATDTDTDTDTDTGGVPTCGWGPLKGDDVDEGYQCGLEGEDPAKDGFPIDCVAEADLTLGADCTEAMVFAEGCCDENANVWFCFDPDGDGPMGTEVGMDDCSNPE